MRSNQSGWLGLLLVFLGPSAAVADDTGLSFVIESTADGVAAYAGPGPTSVSKTLSRETFLAGLREHGVELPSPVRIEGPRREKVLTRQQRERAAWEKVLAHAAATKPTEMIDVVVELRDIGLRDAKEIAAMNKAEAREALDERRAHILDGQQDYVTHALRHGEVVQQGYVSNGLHVRVAASAMQKILDHPDVNAVYPGWQKLAPDYDGKELRDATLLQEFLDAGFAGEGGGRMTTSVGGDNIKIGIFEPVDPLNNFHPGWRDWAGGPSRIVSNWRCIQGCAPNPGSLAQSHGTVTTWVAAGSIEGGQDANQDTPEARASRSGIAQEAAIYYYSVGLGADVVDALGWAAFVGVDVINMSAHIIGCDVDCDPDETCSGVNTKLKTVTDLGVLFVNSAGNEALETSAPCSTNYPGYRPEVIVVGNVDSTGSINYDAAPIRATSSRGFMTVGLGGSLGQTWPTGDIPSIDISAPGTIALYFAEWGLYGDESTHHTYKGEISGTSFAAPVVAAAAGLLREVVGTPLHNAHMLKAAVLLMGDGNDALSVSSGKEAGTSEVFGTGKMKAHRPGALSAPAQYLLHQDHLVELEEELTPFPGGGLPAGVAQWKWVAHVYHPDLSQVPWVIAEVRDKCNGNTVIAGDYFFSPTKYISLSAPLLQTGNCLEMRLYGLSVPSGGVDVYSAAYYSAGDPDDH